MEHYDETFEISEETIAAWLDGQLPPEEETAFMERLSSDMRLAEILDAYEHIESEFESLIEDGYELPSALDLDFTIPDIDLPNHNHNLALDEYSHLSNTDEFDSSDNQENDHDIYQSSDCTEESDNSQFDWIDFC